MTARARFALVGATGRKPSGMEGIHFGGRGGGKADRYAIAGRRFTIARTGDDEGRLFAAVKHPAATEAAKVLDAKGAQGCIVKSNRLFDVDCAEKDVREIPSPEITGVAMMSFLDV